MNFLETPELGLVLNTKMTMEEAEIAGAFVDESIALEVLEPAPVHCTLLNNCLHFLVLKARQPGQYRCIADMKCGQQNEACGAYPVQLPQPGDILPYLYPGGFSACLDISKFFHMFLMREEEYFFLRIIHLITGLTYCYR